MHLFCLNDCLPVVNHAQLVKGITDTLKEFSDLLDKDIDIERAIKLCNESTRKSSKDMYSGGPMDLVVLTKDKVRGYGKRIKQAIDDAESEIIEKIISELSFKASISDEN